MARNNLTVYDVLDRLDEEDNEDYDGDSGESDIDDTILMPLDPDDDDNDEDGEDEVSVDQTPIQDLGLDVEGQEWSDELHDVTVHDYTQSSGPIPDLMEYLRIP